MKYNDYQLPWFPILLGKITLKDLPSTIGVRALVFDDSGSLAAVQTLLRTFTSEWIDSGFAADGSEYPLRRNFAPKGNATMPDDPATGTSKDREERRFRIPQAVQAMAKYMNGQVEVTNTQEGEKYVVFESAVNGYWQPLRTYIEPGGGFRYRQTIKLEESRTGNLGAKEERGNKDHEEYLQIVAADFFVDFYQSQCRFLLMRCRRCGVFVLPKRKPRKRYEYGWHCEGCRSAGTATARMLTVTQEHRQRWLSFAAEAWLRWRSENGERGVWIAEEVNKQLRRTEPRIRRNSITRNSALIARMAEKNGPTNRSI